MKIVGLLPLVILFYYCSTSQKETNKYPNPFSPPANIGYKIERDQNVILIVYDKNWNLVDTLVNKFQNKGYYNANLDFRNKEDGIYYFKLQTENTTYTKKMIMVK